MLLLELASLSTGLYPSSRFAPNSVRQFEQATNFLEELCSNIMLMHSLFTQRAEEAGQKKIIEKNMTLQRRSAVQHLRELKNIAFHL